MSLYTLIFAAGLLSLLKGKDVVSSINITSLNSEVMFHSFPLISREGRNFFVTINGNKEPLHVQQQAHGLLADVFRGDIPASFGGDVTTSTPSPQPMEYWEELECSECGRILGVYHMFGIPDGPTHGFSNVQYDEVADIMTYEEYVNATVVWKYATCRYCE